MSVVYSAWDQREGHNCDKIRGATLTHSVAVFPFLFLLRWVFFASGGLSLVVVSRGTLCCIAWVSH